MSRLAGRHPVQGLLRWAMRLPIWFYRARLGWLLGNRFLLLTHTGRNSGLPRYTVVEVVRHDPAGRTCVVASGWGETSDWLRNILKTPRVVVQIGNRKFPATAARLSPGQAGLELLDYARRHPRAFGALSRLMIGSRLKGTAEDCRELALHVPLIRFQPDAQQESGEV